LYAGVAPRPIASTLRRARPVPGTGSLLPVPLAEWLAMGMEPMGEGGKRPTRREGRWNASVPHSHPNSTCSADRRVGLAHGSGAPGRTERRRSGDGGTPGERKRRCVRRWLGRKSWLSTTGGAARTSACVERAARWNDGRRDDLSGRSAPARANARRRLARPEVSSDKDHWPEDGKAGAQGGTHAWPVRRSGCDRSGTTRRHAAFGHVGAPEARPIGSSRGSAAPREAVSGVTAAHSSVAATRERRCLRALRSNDDVRSLEDTSTTRLCR